MSDDVIRYLSFPSYDDVLAKLAFEKEQGRIELGKHGYVAGDTVYLGGKLKGIIDYAILSSPLFEGLNELMIFVTVNKDDYNNHFAPDDIGTNFSKISIPCTISDIQKERTNE